MSVKRVRAQGELSETVLNLICAQGLLIAAMADLLEKHGAEATPEIALLCETSMRAQNAFKDAIAAEAGKERMT